MPVLTTLHEVTTVKFFHNTLATGASTAILCFPLFHGFQFCQLLLCLTQLVPLLLQSLLKISQGSFCSTILYGSLAQVLHVASA